ncbi:MAG: hypothetical protein IPP22_00480 [Nitrosomonas sp.]|nr:hypothetical protein [Nitrosomonas sp.]
MVFSNGHAFITGPNGTGIRDLGTLGGDHSSASAVNDSGQVVGSSDVSKTAPFYTHAFITGPNGVGMTDLGTPDIPGVYDSAAFNINNSGQVTGFILIRPSPDSYRPTLTPLLLSKWRQVCLISAPLNAWQAASRAYVINDSHVGGRVSGEVKLYSMTHIPSSRA